MKDIGSIINKTIKRAGIEKNVAEARILSFFNDNLNLFLPINLTNLIRAVHISNGFLTIACLDSQAEEYLRMQEKKIISKINKEIGAEIVKKFRYLT